MEETQAQEPILDRPANGIPPHRWFIGVLADGNYYFITPESHDEFVKYIGEHGGGLYTHAGWLVVAADQGWFNFLTRKYNKEHVTTPVHLRPPHIDVPNIKCRFSKPALKWLEENEEMLKEIGGKYYANIPKR